MRRTAVIFHGDKGCEVEKVHPGSRVGVTTEPRLTLGAGKGILRRDIVMVTSTCSVMMREKGMA